MVVVRDKESRGAPDWIKTEALGTEGDSSACVGIYSTASHIAGKAGLIDCNHAHNGQPGVSSIVCDERPRGLVVGRYIESVCCVVSRLIRLLVFVQSFGREVVVRSK